MSFSSVSSKAWHWPCTIITETRQSQKIQEETSGSLLRVKMKNGFLPPCFSAAELHELTHLLSSSCPWGKHLSPVLNPQCYGFHLAQYRLLLSQLGPHCSTISLHLSPPQSCSAPEPHHCDRSSFCYISKSKLKKATTSLWGKNILPSSLSTQFPKGLLCLWGRHNRTENSDFKETKNNNKKEVLSVLLSRNYGTQHVEGAKVNGISI